MPVYDSGVKEGKNRSEEKIKPHTSNSIGTKARNAKQSYLAKQAKEQPSMQQGQKSSYYILDMVQNKHFGFFMKKVNDQSSEKGRTAN